MVFVLGDLAELLVGGDARVGEDDIESALLLLDRSDDAVEVSELGDVTDDAGDVLADGGDCGVELLLGRAVMKT